MQTVADTNVLGQMFGHRQVKLLMRGVAAALVVAGVMLFLDWGLRSGTMPIEEITFKGQFKNITHAQLEKVVAKYIENNFLMVNLEVIQSDIEKLPWIYRASVRRKWPTGLYVEFKEQDPVARWGDAAWINSNGDIIKLNNFHHDENDYPIIKGPEKNSAQLLKSFVLYQKLFKETGMNLSGMTVSDRNSYRLTTSAGIEIILGKQNIDFRVKRFLEVYRNNLSGHQGAFSRVDLRYTNGFAVLWNETASINYKQEVLRESYDKT